MIGKYDVGGRARRLATFDARTPEPQGRGRADDGKAAEDAPDDSGYLPCLAVVFLAELRLRG